MNDLFALLRASLYYCLHLNMTVRVLKDFSNGLTKNLHISSHGHCGVATPTLLSKSVSSASMVTS